MIDINIHAKSLNVSWIRTLFSSHDCNIFHMFLSFLPNRHEFKIDMGSAYFNQLAEATLNPFWKEVLQDFSDFVRLQKEDFACQPLWKDDYILINNNVYLKTLKEYAL